MPKPRRKATQPYSRGELNKLVDAVCHPLFKENPAFIFIDGFLHGLIERNPPVTVRKFMKHNFPKLVKQLREKSKQTIA